MRKATVRELKDASRVAAIMALVTAAASFTYEYADVPPLPPTKGTVKTILLRDLSWVLVTAVVLLIPRLGETGTKCLERLLGTVLGGGAGLIAALLHSAPGATAVAALTGAAGELLGSAGNLNYAGKMVSVTFAVVAMPSFGSLGQPRVLATDRAVVRLAAERMIAVCIGVGLVYVASVTWFPRAASEEAFGFAEDTVVALRDMAAACFQPAVMMCGDDDGRGGSGQGENGKAAVPPPVGAFAAMPSPCTAAAKAKAAYLALLASRSLDPTTGAAVRAAHIADCETRLQAAAVARGRLKLALDVAQREVVVGRLPFASCDCGGAGGGCASQPRTRAAATEGDKTVDAAAAALPSPQPPAHPRLAWHPIYVPVLGTASASWIRRLAPAAFARRALPSSHLAGVGAACGAVGRALWISGDAAGGGFPRYMSDLVKTRYGDGVVPARGSSRLSPAKSAPAAPVVEDAASAAAQEAERAEAAGVVEDLAALLVDCLTEALDALVVARQTYLIGAVPPGRQRTGPDLDPHAAAMTDLAVRARWPALCRLQDAQCAIGQRRTAFDQAEEATLAGVEKMHARRAGRRPSRDGSDGGGGGTSSPAPSSPLSPFLPPLPPTRLPNTLEATAVRIRWLALLFGFGECRHGLEELAAAVEALRDACEAAVGATRGVAG